MTNMERVSADKAKLEALVGEQGLERGISDFLQDCGDRMPEGISPESAAREIILTAERYTESLRYQLERNCPLDREELSDCVAEKLRDMDYSQSVEYLIRLVLGNQNIMNMDAGGRGDMEEEYHALRAEIANLSDQEKVDLLMERALKGPDIANTLLKIVSGPEEAEHTPVAVRQWNYMDMETAAICGAVLYREQLFRSEEKAATAPGVITLQQAAVHDTVVAVAAASDPAKVEEAYMALTAIEKSVSYVLSWIVSAAGYTVSFLPLVGCGEILFELAAKEGQNVLLHFLLNSATSAATLVAIIIFIIGGLLFLENRPEIQAGLINLKRRIMAQPAVTAGGRPVWA